MSAPLPPTSRPARRPWSAALLVACTVAATACGRATIPGELPDAEFRRLVAELSEPAGTFTHSDNLVSNEALFADTMRTLRSRGGAYIGVGPEQNFSYIAEIRPVIAFVVEPMANRVCSLAA